MQNTENYISIYRNNHYPIIIERCDNNLNMLLDCNWMKNGSLANPNDQQFIPDVTPSDVLTMYDEIYNRQLRRTVPIQFYTQHVLRPQMTINYIDNAVSTIRNFFSNNSLVATSYASSSGGMTSHCLIRINNLVYNIYITMANGPTHIELIDETFINLISLPF